MQKPLSIKNKKNQKSYTKYLIHILFLLIMAVYFVKQVRFHALGWVCRGTDNFRVKNMEKLSTVEKNAENETNGLVSITEAARIHNVTRQAIYVAIKSNKLRARKETRRWMIDLADLREYKRLKYSRTRSVFDGELLFDNMKGFFSVNQVAKLLSVPAQKIYYAARSGYLKATRKGAAWVIHENDVKSYKDQFFNAKKRKAS